MLWCLQQVKLTIRTNALKSTKKIAVQREFRENIAKRGNKKDFSICEVAKMTTTITTIVDGEGNAVDFHGEYFGISCNQRPT